jgi:hypothetical protein
MQGVVDAMKQLDATKVTVAFRIINEVPFSELVGACPPVDWRSPPVIAAYNSQLRKIVPPHFVLLDPIAIVSPMWDASDDWNHLPNPVQRADADYCLFHLMNTSLRQQRKM